MGVCLCVSHTRASLTLFTPSLRFFLILLWHFSFKQKIKTFPMATALKASLAFLPLSHPYPCQSISRVSRKSKTNPQRSSLTATPPPPPPPSRVPPLSLPVLVCLHPEWSERQPHPHTHARTHSHTLCSRRESLKNLLEPPCQKGLLTLFLLLEICGFSPTLLCPAQLTWPSSPGPSSWSPSAMC